MEFNENKPKSGNSFIRLPIYLAVATIIGIYIGKRFASFDSTPQSVGMELFSSSESSDDKVVRVIDLIVNNYVDTINREKLREYAINGILEQLDPHSYYVSAEEFKTVNDPLIGSFDGIGIEFRIVKDTVVVMAVVPGGPSEEEGLRAGDRIVSADEKNIAGVKITNEKVIKLLKGKRGTNVKVGIVRPNVKDVLYFTITRDQIPMNSLDIAYMINRNTGYIKISRFSQTTHQEFMDALLQLKAEGMENLIFDLRGNNGGYLDVAIDISDEFLERNRLIVYTQGINKAKTTAFATKKGNFEQGNLVVLIDDWSASASEIVAGAVQDNDRGWVIGRRSFGKGLVQEQLPLGDGSAIRLTIARYYTPSGRCIQSAYDKGLEQYYMDFYKRFTSGEIDSKDSIHLKDTTVYKTIGGRTVYGGGGIMPDIFVPVDRSQDSKYYSNLLNKALIYQFAFDYSDKNRDVLKKRYSSVQRFINGFVVTDALLNEMMNYAQDNGVEKDLEGLKVSGKAISNSLKAYIGRNLFSDKGFYPILNEEDQTIDQALEVIKSEKSLPSEMN